MDAIILQGVKTHNLKNLDLILPHHQLYVITGVSGSGKSSLAFDTLYAEGQRRYVESLSAYARQFLERMEKPPADSITGTPPALAIQAKNVITNARSTVGTQTEINDYLRVLFARIGKTICPDCNIEVFKSQPQSIYGILLKDYSNQEAWILFKVTLGKRGRAYLKEFTPELEKQGFYEFFSHGKVINREQLVTNFKGENFIILCSDRIKINEKSQKRIVESLEQAFRYGKGEVEVYFPENETHLKFAEGMRCRGCGRDFKELSPNLFSFNSPLGACATCQGFGRVITLDWNLIVPDENKSIEAGAIEPWTKPSADWEWKQLLKFCQKKKIPTDKPWNKLSLEQQRWILKGTGVKGDDYFSVKDFYEYLEKKTYKMHVRIFLSKYRTYIPCSDCQETRLKPAGLWVQLNGKNIYEIQKLSFSDLLEFIDHLKISQNERERIEPVYLEIQRRVKFLNEVGLGYLSLARLSRTLSGGEVQRIHLATSLGSALVDTLYVLDEPSIGLHERDNRLLIRLLQQLRDLGNTVVVVEHDPTMIESADEVIDMGPLGGEQGGQILFQGKIRDLKNHQNSLTGKYLSGRMRVERRHFNAKKPEKWIEIKGAHEHNLKQINVKIPLKRFTVITGVSGSGKSTLLYEILYRHYQKYRGRPVQDLGKVESIHGFDQIDEIVLIDQSPIGRTPRSNPATYLKAFDDIRKIFSRTPQSRRQGFEAGYFSFNVDGGRCPVCKGDGRVKVEMHFLADVFIPCEECHEKRFKPEILEIEYQGKNIDEVLNMTVDDAIKFFQNEKNLVQKLTIMQKVGLGYLRLGQSANTLSGGEAQRLKLASEMLERNARHILYLFDEPTTGLHHHDIHYLMSALDELIVRGHSLVIIEHNMEMISGADYLVDLGPEGGEKGGRLVYQGPTLGIIDQLNSYTGQYLKKRQTNAMIASNVSN